MLKHLLKGLLAGLAVKVLDNYRQLSLQLLKIEAAKAYLRGVHLARLSVLGLIQMGLLLGFIGLGVLLVHVGIFILLPWTVEAKALLAVCLGVAYTVLGGLTLRAAFDEKTWMDRSGATKLLENAIGPAKKD